jgi:hypothetical protein
VGTLAKNLGPTILLKEVKQQKKELLPNVEKQIVQVKRFEIIKFCQRGGT